MEQYVVLFIFGTIFLGMLWGAFFPPKDDKKNIFPNRKQGLKVGDAVRVFKTIPLSEKFVYRDEYVYIIICLFPEIDEYTLDAAVSNGKETFMCHLHELELYDFRSHIDKSRKYYNEIFGK
jgi:hypothetical protein